VIEYMFAWFGWNLTTLIVALVAGFAACVVLSGCPDSPDFSGGCE
jgi:hypothetical protein